MIRLITLGSLTLLDSGGRRSEALQRKPLSMALLVYVALRTRDGGVSADEVVGRFWGERPERQARGAFNQAVYVLREHLGGDVIRRSGDEVSLHRERLWCDAAALLDLAEARRWSESADAYSGEFLPGFISPLTDVDHWVDTTRANLRTVAAEAALNAAQDYAIRKNLLRAVQYADKAAVTAGPDEQIVLRAVELLADAGCADAALEMYERHARAMEALELEPLESVVRAVEAIRRTMRSTPPSSSHESPASTRAAGFRSAHTAPGRSLGRAVMFAAAAMAFVTVIVLLGFLLRPAARPAATMPASIVVVDETGAEPGPVGSRVPGVFARHVAASLAAAGHSVRLVEAQPDVQFEQQPGTGSSFVVRLQVESSILDSVVVHALVENERSRRVEERVRTAWSPSSLDETVEEAAERVSIQLRQSMGRSLRRTAAAAHREPQPLINARRDRARADSLHATGDVGAAWELLSAVESDLAHMRGSRRVGRRHALERAAIAEALFWLSFEAPVSSRRVGRAALDRGLTALQETGDGADPDIAVREAELLYWLWRTAPAESASAFADTRARARELLEGVVERVPGRHDAWARLAIIYEAEADFVRGYRAARTALAADLFAEYEPETSIRLYSLALETGDTIASRRSCRRFPSEHYVRAACEATLAYHRGTTSAAEVERVRRLIDRAVASPQGAWNEPGLRLLLAAVLASAGEREEAVRIEEQVTAATTDDAELPVYRVMLRTALQDYDGAAALLHEHVSRQPATRGFLWKSALFRHLAAL